MKITGNFGFYSILTNPVVGYRKLTELIVEYNFPFVQLRMKDQPIPEIFAVAKELRNITKKSKTKLIINDYLEIAREVNADGLHIGQGDISYATARKILGEDKIIGLSTHSTIQVQDANKLKPDYIGIGPVFKTPTKKKPDAVIGITGMESMIKIALFPYIVIGGIDFSNIRQVLNAGAKNFCFVRQLNQSKNPEKILKQIRTFL